MILRMAKIRMIGPMTLLEQVTEFLQELGVIHLETLPVQHKAFPAIRRFSINPAHQKRKEEIEKLRKDLRDLIISLPEIRLPLSLQPMDQGLTWNSPLLLREIRKTLDELYPKIKVLSDQMRDFEEEQGLLSKYENVLEALAPLLQKIRQSHELDFIGIVIEAEKEAVIQGIREVLSEITENRYELFLSRVNPNTLAGLLVIPHNLSGRVRSSLWQENISELKLPMSLKDKPVGQALQILLRRRIELPRQIQELRESLRRLSFQWRDQLIMYEKWIENRLAQIESAAAFYQTRTAFLLYGWLPERELPVMVQRLTEVFRGQVAADWITIHRNETGTVPVVLRNIPVIKSFEPFIRLVALPRYGSIDPTPFLAFFFPFFFGMILGDVGYGVLVLALALYGRRRWSGLPLAKDFSVVFILASVSAIIFGFLYGEFFGELGTTIGIHPILVNRMEGFILLMKITLGIGFCHVCLGIFLGMITAIRYREGKELMIKSSGLIFLGAILLMIAGITGTLKPFVTVIGEVTGGLALLMIFSLAGARSSMELHLVVNVLSYLRLMGIGVASAALAFAANTLGKLSGSIVIGILIGGVLHFINLLFGIFSPAIQSLRLHYVEFFENFYLPGGREYRPFRKG